MDTPTNSSGLCKWIESDSYKKCCTIGNKRPMQSPELQRSTIIIWGSWIKTNEPFFAKIKQGQDAGTEINTPQHMPKLMYDNSVGTRRLRAWTLRQKLASMAPCEQEADRPKLRWQPRLKRSSMTQHHWGHKRELSSDSKNSGWMEPSQVVRWFAPQLY